jgi:hypothetical protein
MSSGLFSGPRADDHRFIENPCDGPRRYTIFIAASPANRHTSRTVAGSGLSRFRRGMFQDCDKTARQTAADAATPGQLYHRATGSQRSASVALTGNSDRSECVRRPSLARRDDYSALAVKS